MTTSGHAEVGSVYGGIVAIGFSLALKLTHHVDFFGSVLKTYPGYMTCHIIMGTAF